MEREREREREKAMKYRLMESCKPEIIFCR